MTSETNRLLAEILEALGGLITRLDSKADKEGLIEIIGEVNGVPAEIGGTYIIESG